MKLLRVFYSRDLVSSAVFDNIHGKVPQASSVPRVGNLYRETGLAAVNPNASYQTIGRVNEGETSSTVISRRGCCPR